MRVSLNQIFDAERHRYRLRFACEDCVYHDAARARCSHGYPSAVHQRAAFEAEGQPEGARAGMFCKEFELV